MFDQLLAAVALERSYQTRLAARSRASGGKYKQTRRAFAKLKWVVWGVDWTRR